MKLLVFLLLFSVQLFAQTGIGTTTPHASAKLEVSASDKGFLPPRVTLTSATDITTIASPAEGLMVYNVGSVGLQAGYYYWNGANWATIATASSTGSGVAASNLVKLYGEAYSAVSGKIGHTNGYSFTVSVSGRYLFDFSCTGYSNATITYKVRQGTTDIGTDAQTSYNNTVHVEYNGKIEANLQAGVTYNVYVNSTGNRDSGDYDRVYYKLVAGNLPVNQHLASANIQLNNNYLSNDGGNEGIRVDNSGNVGIGTNTPTAILNIAGGGVRIASGLGNTSTRPSVNTSTIGNYEIRGVGGGASQIDAQDDGFLRLSAGGGTNAIQQSSIDLSGYSATVPDMNSNIVMRTAGTERVRIDNSGSVNITGKINLTDPSGNVTVKVAAFVDAGTFVTLDNLKATVTTSAPRGLSLATVSGTLNLYVQGVYTNQSGTANTSYTGTPVTYTTTASGSPFGWNFEGAGNTIIYHLTDATNSRLYRVTLIIMPSYFKNFISIERLL
ncbi:hypothetical protein ACST14_08815 [Aquirufa sp. A-Brett2-15D]